ncbi:MAG: ABC transporter permease [Elusimicrobiota bacterium]
MNRIIELSLTRLIVAYIFIAMVIAFISARRMRREKEVVLATLRMTLQLVAVGYVLVYIFENANPFFTVGAILLMEVFAVHNIFRRVKIPLSYQLKKIIALSMGAGNLVTIVFFLFAVIGLSPWYDPRYFIPIAGMIIGNSMTGISLGVFKMVDGFKSRRSFIEAALMLGASPGVAAREVVNSSFDAAILPVINIMVGMGIVFLPGMMTGQILAGVSPVTSIKYQLAIMLAITGSVALTVIIFIILSFKTFFNSAAQLKL